MAEQLAFSFSFPDREWDWIGDLEKAQIVNHLWDKFLEMLWAQGGDIGRVDQYYSFNFCDKRFLQSPDSVGVKHTCIRRLTAIFHWEITTQDPMYRDPPILKVTANLLGEKKNFPIYFDVKYIIPRGSRIEALTSDAYAAYRRIVNDGYERARESCYHPRDYTDMPWRAI